MGESLRNLEGEAARRLSKFDPAEVRRLRDRDWRTFDAAPGLRIERAGRVWTWIYRYASPIDGRTRQQKIGNWPALGWEAAWTRWDALRRGREEGVDPQLDRRAKRAEARAKHAAERAASKRRAVTVEKLVRKYLAEHTTDDEGKPLAEKTRYDSKRMFEGRVLPKLGYKPAVSIDRDAAEDFLAAVKLEAPALARLLRSRLGGAWEHGRRLLPRGHENPWRDALRGKLKGKARTRFLDDRELAVFLEKVAEFPEDVRDALLLALYTAARSGEIVGMDWKTVDLKRGTWTLQETKTDAPRTIRLPRQALAIMERRDRGFEIPQGALSAALREAKHFKLKPFTAHDLRRSARTGLSRIAIRDEVAEACLGHIEGGIRGTYNLHAYEAEVGKALQAWCDHLHALAAPEVVPLPSKTASRGG